MKQIGKNTHGWSRLTALVLAMALLLAGCGGPAEAPADTGVAGTEPAETEPADATPTEQLSEEEQALLRLTGLAANEAVEITDADAQEINAAVAGMRAVYAAGPGGEDPLVEDRNWDAYTSSLGEENLSRREAEFYSRLDKLCLSYLRTSGLDGIENKSSGSSWYTTEGVQFNDLGLSTEQAGSVYIWFRYSHPQYYFLDCGYSYTASSLFPMVYETMADGEDRAKITNELFDKLDGWIKTVEDSAATTYQKELYANNLICETANYNYAALDPGHEAEMYLCQSLYSTVMLESTVCAGYSMAFTAMMSALGVDVSAALSDSHAWNVVRNEDGKYYAVDVCWNDSNTSNPYYTNNYFNVGIAGWTTQSIADVHTYSNDVAAWIPAISAGNYVPTSKDTDSTPSSSQEPGGSTAQDTGNSVPTSNDTDPTPDASQKPGEDTAQDTSNYETKEYSNGDVYVGEMKNGVPNGYGKMTYAKAHTRDAVYEGEWKDGKKNGHGIYTYPNGTVYDGEWKDDNRNGQGICTYENGDVYEGEWKDDKWNGYGILTYADVSVYEGEFKDGKKNGQGICTYENGDVYEGEWKNGKKNGHGILTYANGSVVEGEWENDKQVS